VSSEVRRRPARSRNATYNITFVMQSRRHIMITAPRSSNVWITDPSISYSRGAWIESYPSQQILRLEEIFVVFLTLLVPMQERAFQYHRVFFQVLIHSSLLFSQFILWFAPTTTDMVAQLVQALRYKPVGRGFDSLSCHWNFPLT
jgi:hypothetical protein